ncbi:CHAT domain-containing tetratricopeptide repeat protein [Streptomyces sp. NPDC051364]|uniref:CHAT domain-containing tetratricopeptide repeat protein n=1 Tax=Streptomyces sp. NPDC051364 TaxID=3155799 RepID=UPI003418A7FD
MSDPGGPERAVRLAAMEVRLQRVVESQDLAPVLEAGALREAQLLAELLPGGDGLPVYHLLGWFSWFRHLAVPVPADQAQPDLRDAVMAFTACFLAGVGDLPEPLLPLLAENAAASAMPLLEDAWRSDDQAELSGLVNLWQRIVEAIPVAHPHRAVHLTALGNVLRLVVQRGGPPEDLDAAIDRFREALASAFEERGRAMYLFNLGDALRARYEQAGAVADLESAIPLLREAVQLAPDDRLYRTLVLTGLGNALCARFQRTRTMADLESAISLHREAVHVMPVDHPDRARVLSNLGNVLRARFEQAGDIEDLEAAVETGRQAVGTATRHGSESRAVALSNLANALRLRYERTGAIGDLEAAIKAGWEALDALPAGHRHRLMILSNLGISLQDRFARVGLPADVDSAIEVGSQAVEAAAPGHPDRAMFLSNLGGALRVRFERIGALADLNAAIDRLREAVEAVPAGHPERVRYLSNLGNMLRARFARNRDIGDLDAAIEMGRRAVDAAPAHHHHRAMFLSNLGAALQVRFARTGAVADLDAAIVRLREAVEAVPADHPHRARYLSNLGPALRTRFSGTGVRSDLDAAVDVGRQAVRTTPADHPERAVYLNNLGDALLTRFQQDGDAADREAAVATWSAASTTPSATVSIRVDAGLSAARLLAQSGDAERAADTADAAVRLMPRLAPRRLERQDQQHVIGNTAGMTATAAALVLAAPGGTADGRAERALGLLEVGRAVLLGQALEIRSDLTDLRERQPELAQRFAELRDRMDQPADTPADTQVAIEDDGDGAPHRPRQDLAVQNRHRLAEEFTAVLAEIRTLEGFASFAIPPTVDELRAEASQGAIVVFNVSSYRSDALLLTAESITSLPLPQLEYTTVVDRVNAFRQAQHTAVAGADPEEREQAQSVLVDVLEWLWNAAAGPVLDALGHQGPPPTTERAGDVMPRVWWVPGGLLGLLPLHAAGHHTDTPDDPHRRTVMDRVVSSYTPTVRALRYARERSRREGNDPTAAGRALVVAMPTTPGLPGQGRLRFVDAEVAMLEARFPDPVVLRERDHGGGQADPAPATTPTKARVLARLPHCAIAHFACHGSSDPADPSQSRLLLHDHEDDPLTVKSLAPVALDHVRLAYLSACRTAAVDTVDLLDEAIHLTSAFQLAGFPHVIGTLWEIDDQTAVRIARAFYDGLGAGSAAVDPDRAARALHEAVRQLRDGDDLPPGYDRRGTPLLWAAHLHAGA